MRFRCCTFTKKVKIFAVSNQFVKCRSDGGFVLSLMPSNHGAVNGEFL